VERHKADTPDWLERPIALVPNLVAEVIAPTDNIDILNRKIDQYLADGVRLIWAIDPQRRKAIIYAPNREQPLHLTGDELLDGGDVIPGFQVPLSKLFD